MKCLSLIQPFATLVAVGAKQIETRSWSTSYRGPLAIHASKGFPKAYSNLCDLDVFMEAFSRAGLLTVTRDEEDLKDAYLDYSVFPLGAVVATCELVDCVQVGEREHFIPRWENGNRVVAVIPPIWPELAFGNYAAGRWAWILGNVKKLDTPVPARGAMSLWEWEYHG